MSQQLNTTEVGVISLYATIKGKREQYVCSSLSLTMQLNALPVASVVIGCGKNIRDGGASGDNNAEDILEYVMDASNNEPDSYIDCSIVETLRGRDITIFEGCIIAASLVYKAGNVTVRAVRVECMNAACKLYARPLSAYTNSCGSHIIQNILQDYGTDTKQNNAATYGWNRIGSLEQIDVIQALNQITYQKDIATKIAYIADMIARLTAKAENATTPLDVDSPDTILNIGKYIRSDYFVNYGLFTDVGYDQSGVDDKIDYILATALLDSLRSNSIFESIIGMIISTEFMLTLVPGWTGNGFMMSIKPSQAWLNTPSKTISFSDVSEFNSAYKPIDHINDPEVFCANFAPALPMDGKEGDRGATSSMMGVYSTNPLFRNWLANVFNDDSSEDNARAAITEDLSRFKWSVHIAPTWLSMLVQQGVLKAEPKLDNLRTQTKENEKIEPDQSTRNYINERIVANEVAKAMYVHMHGESATAQLTLLPSLRFGLKDGIALEDHIGEVIDIIPDKMADSHLAMRGVITALQFNYSAGQSASCSYTMTLSRVRPRNQQAESITCPLYTDYITAKDN